MKISIHTFLTYLIMFFAALIAAGTAIDANMRWIVALYWSLIAFRAGLELRRRP